MAEENKKEVGDGVSDFDAAYRAGQLAGGFEIIPQEKVSALGVFPRHLRVEDLEKFLPAPLLIEAAPAFTNAGSFIAYVNRFKDGDSLVFAKNSAEELSFEAALDYHKGSGEGARWGKHTAGFHCQYSEEWKVWRKNDRLAMDHRSFIGFIETNLLDISAPPQARMMEVIRDIKLKKAVQFESGHDLASGDVQFEYREKSEGAKGTLDIPSEFEIAIPVFLGSPSAPAPTYPITAKLRFKMSDGKLALSYELVRPHKVLEAAFGDVFQQVETGTGIKVLLGSK